MESIQALRERRSATAVILRDLLDKNPGDKWLAEHQASYDAGIDEINKIDASIAREEKLNDIQAKERVTQQVTEALDKKAKDTNSPRSLFDRWLRRGDKGLSAEDWMQIQATMSTTTNTEGGHTVPTEVATQVVDALKAFGGMRAVSDVFSTSGFGDLNYPTSDGTSEVGEIIAQNTTATGLDPSFGVVTITAYKYSSKIVAVPFELLQDTAIDMEAFIRTRLVQRLGRITNTHFTTGTGSSQPRGVVTGSGVGKTGTTGQTTTVIFDDLVDLVHSVDPEYRAGPVRFMMADASMAKVRKLKDSQNRPIFIPGWDGLGRAMGDTILGYPVTINQDVAVMAASAKSILFGDFSYYKIRDVMAMQMFRFDDSAYIKLGQIGFLAWMRSGGNLVDAGAVKHYANSAT